MYKVFINNKAVILTSNKSTEFPSVETFVNHYKGKDDLKKAIEHFTNDDKNNLLVVYHRNLKQLWKDFSFLYTRIDAAGGLVKNNKGEFLFIYRREKWDLPKGKVEQGENIQCAALREVEEECGINQLTIIKQLSSTYHTYDLNGKKILKCTYWYEMLCSDAENISPQVEEDITEVRWFNKKDIPMVLKNTYSSIQEIVTNFL